MCLDFLIFKYISDNVRCKIYNLFQFLNRNIKKQSSSWRNWFEIPNMGNRSSKFYMSSSLTSYLASCNFNSTSFTNHSFISYSFIFSTCTFVIFSWTENLFTKKSTSFRSLCSVIYGFRNKNFSIWKCSDLFFWCDSNSYSSKIIKIFTLSYIFFSSKFSNLRIICDFIIEKIFKIFIF
ncbi:MAG: hypothetical protein ACD_4C00446G0002 [uncultured bacterium (gcode 4)]|uniref:Uncharacterized protein n=1 Tax=uncultured bacterium (gcode 4) TaxID=1234023 RepID=K2G7M1_9BACT|nr:MAG: hypothetical protein ACD_4C00446G0002 [uncultured bacterium (gcode 4)]